MAPRRPMIKRREHRPTGRPVGQPRGSRGSRRAFRLNRSHVGFSLVAEAACMLSGNTMPSQLLASDLNLNSKKSIETLLCQVYGRYGVKAKFQRTKGHPDRLAGIVFVVEGSLQTLRSREFQRSCSDYLQEVYGL